MKQLYKKHMRNIIFTYLIIAVSIVLILYPLLPKILNYPPDSIDNTFQKELEGLTYTAQYALLICVVVFLEMTILIHRSRSLTKCFTLLEESSTPLSIEDKTTLLTQIRNYCLNTPYLVYYLEIFIPIFFLPTLFLFLKASTVTIIKICIVYISFLTLSAVFSFVFSRNGFRKILILLHDNYTAIMDKIEFDFSKRKHKKTESLPFKLILQLIPLVIVSLVFTSLISFVQASKKNNEGNYSYYKYILDEIDLASIRNKQDILDILSSSRLLDSSDGYFIINEDGTYITSNQRSLTNFFIKYTLEKSDMINGHTYDYFALDTAGISKKFVSLNGETYYFGFIYNSNLYLFLTYILISDFILLAITFIILLYVTLSLSRDIKTVTYRLNEIALNNKTSFNFNSSLAITSKDELSDLILSFNSIQQVIKSNIETIQSNQSQLIEQERLASLGQMIGGIAHNLKTPIMSIAGAAEGLKDLANELDNSIGNPIVTNDDYHEIAKDMNKWIDKIKNYSEYMSDIITAVKGQAVKFTNDEEISFTISELLKRVDILMKHELKNAIIYLNTSVQTDENTVIKGDVNSLVQIINNMISNSIQAYCGKPDQNIDLIVTQDNSKCIISIKDYAGGLPEKIKDKLFKEMITTKGKNGTGLGLYMSYSTIKAHFNGDITFESEPGKGTTFNIILPL